MPAMLCVIGHPHARRLVSLFVVFMPCHAGVLSSCPVCPVLPVNIFLSLCEKVREKKGGGRGGELFLFVEGVGRKAVSF